jgi:hypothetical protein
MAREFQPLAKKYCFSCHSGSASEGGFSLDTYPDEKAIGGARKVWQRLAGYVAQKHMPPADHDAQPTDAEREKMLAWVKGALERTAPKAGDPGRVTVRRLNRAEYNNTVRDLLGIEDRPADEFPVDNSGYGFDTIGDVLSVSPLLMEKYLAAAERIAGQVIADPTALKPSKTRLDTSRMKGGSEGGGSRVLASGGTIEFGFPVPKAGDYLLRIGAYGDQAGNEPVKYAVRMGGKELRRSGLKNTRDNPGEIIIPVQLPAGRARFGVVFLNDFWDEKSKADRNLHLTWAELEAVASEPKHEELPPLHRRVIPETPDRKNVAKSADAVIRPLLRRAFRRKVSDKEIRKYVDLVVRVTKDGGAFEDGVRIALEAMLVSPKFLYRWEWHPEPNNPDSIHELTQYDLANRVSYFLWSSMPDDTLLSLADEGKLTDPKVLEEQVKRMLADPKSAAMVENFAGQWLETRKLTTVNPDPKAFPGYDEALLVDFRKETEMYFEHIMRENRSVLEFLDSDYTFVNDRLAKLYGVQGVWGRKWRKAQLPDRNRGGVITQGSFLTITSNPTRTSPVKRGKWILEQLLNDPPPPPDPNAGTLPDDKEGAKLTGTLRQRFELHRSKPACINCHAKMDPLGFGLENFNAVGGWRKEDGGAAVDSSGELPGGVKFSGPAELKKVLLSRRDQFVRCLTEKLMTYALGRGMDEADQPVIARIAEGVAKQDHRFAALVTEIVKSDPFTRRRGEGDRP